MTTTILIIVGLIIIINIAYFILRKRRKDEPKNPTNLTGNILTEPQKPIINPEKPVEILLQEKREKFIIDAYHKAIESFNKIVRIPDNCELSHYLECLTYECYYQYYEQHSNVGMPAFYLKENFSAPYDYWKEGNQKTDYCFNKMLYWLFALVLAEFRTDKKEELLKHAYDDKDNAVIFGYNFETDPNVARIVASAIYATARGVLKQFDRDTMRNDVDGNKIDMTAQEAGDSDSVDIEDSPFWVDFREFIPAKPGPYAPGYKEPRRATYTDENLDEYLNLEMDRKIHEYIVENFNLDIEQNKQRTVLAIADKDGSESHIFGDSKTTEHYHFHPVFGIETIGQYISPTGYIAYLTDMCKCICSKGREILQSKRLDPKEYGRLRPGCSWTEEGKPNSTTDERRNVLVNFEIEDGDGNPTGYYDEDGHWVYPDIIASEEDFINYYWSKVYANSYPSGHSAAIMGVAMMLMEIMPDKADLIFREANEFSYNRTVARYHWTSDTINGRIVGAVISAMLRATKDFDDMLELAKKEIS